MQQDETGFWRNVGVLAGVAFIAPLLTEITKEPVGFDKVSWSWPWVVASLCFIGIVGFMGVQAMNMSDQHRWRLPSLHLKSSGSEEPVQVHYMNALGMFSIGAGYFVLGWFDPEVRWLWEIPVSAGIGIWLGMRFYIWAFPNRFEQREGASRRKIRHR
ncbi:hypothetical protein ABZR86_17660 [Dyella marensis]|uniref:hypothetical protein n=1 Tax=Dyella TaxID=231454 RepID=UPI00116063FA|nr:MULTISPECIES: hypothetical protein [Dyella]